MTDKANIPPPVPELADWVKLWETLEQARVERGDDSVPEAPLPPILSIASFSTPLDILMRWASLFHWAHDHGFAHLIQLPPPPSYSVPARLAGHRGHPSGSRFCETQTTSGRDVAAPAGTVWQSPGWPWWEYNAVHIAAEYGSVSSELWSEGRLPNELDGAGETPLMRAAEAGQVEAVVELLRAGALANVVTPADSGSGRTALGKLGWCTDSAAAMSIARLLIAGGGLDDVSGGALSLEPLVLCEKTELVRLLLQSGAKVELPGPRTLLHVATLLPSRQPEIAALLVGAGADVLARDAAGNLPIHLAAEEGDEIVVEQLLTVNGLLQLNARKSDGRTPLHLAAEYPSQGLWNLLVAAGADINLLDDRGISARSVGKLAGLI